MMEDHERRGIFKGAFLRIQGRASAMLFVSGMRKFEESGLLHLTEGAAVRFGSGRQDWH